VTTPPDLERVGDLLGAVSDWGHASAEADAGPRSVSGSGVPCRPALDPARLLATVWPDVVGPDVAANARPVQFRQGRLVVSASSSAWAHTLHLMSEAIVARLNERLGPGTVESAVFRHAGWEEGPVPPARRQGRGPSAARPRSGESGVDAHRSEGLTKEQEAALAAVDALEVPPDLREKMKRAIRAAFVRGGQDFVR